MINFLHTFHPEPILISLGPVNIYWYGFFILLGALAAISVTIKLASYYNIDKNIIIDLAFWLIIGGIIGARIYHVLLELPYYINHPLNIFKIWQGGLAIHGGIIAGIIIIWIFASRWPLVSDLRHPYDFKRKECGSSEDAAASAADHWSNFWLLTALLTPGLALAQAIGRWGNYFNQELFGLPTGKAWGIPIDIVNRPIEYITSGFFHPTFIYESLGNLFIFIILIAIHVWIIKNKKNTTSYKLQATSYLILYSILRFSLEFIRIDATPEFLGLRWPQVISLFIILVSLIFLALTLLLPKLKNSVNIK